MDHSHAGGGARSSPEGRHGALAHERRRQLQHARRQPGIDLHAGALQARVRDLAARVGDAHVAAVLACSPRMSPLAAFS